MDSKKAVAAGGGLSIALLMWMLSQQVTNEAAHAKAHLEMAKQIAVLQTRLDYRLGKPAPEEAAEAVQAAAAAEEAHAQP